MAPSSYAESSESAGDFRVPRDRAPRVHCRLQRQLMEAISPVLFEDPWDAWRIVADFETQFGQEMGYRHVSAVQSGSAGLRLGLLACGVKPGDEVITVANSDIATSAAISQCGATPVLCDVLASDYTVDTDQVEALITPRTVGLLPVDLYGHPADVRCLRQIADRHDLFIVEDAALATGARDYGVPVGAFADLSVFSCSTHKPFAGIGNGGLVVTDDRELWERIDVLKGYGRPAGTSGTKPVRYDHVVEGYNLTMTPIAAAVLLVKLPYLQAWSDRRREVGGWYRERLEGLDDVVLPSFRPESSPIFRTFTVQIRERNRVFDTMRENGVEAALHYVPPIHLQSVYAERDLPGSENLPVTEELGQSLLCLPVHPEIEEREVDYVCDLLRSVLVGAPS